MKRFFLVLVTALAFFAATAQNKYSWQTATSGGFTYKTVAGDPTKARFYTLKNGLTVILTVNKKEPRVAAQIAVRAGSNTDPADHTGLAHYLEHLLFKGTDKFGTLNFAEEKKHLDRIDALYEQYNKTTDPEKRKSIYQEIDRESGAAAKLSIANEYDKMMASIGSQGTNAHTWVEETVYEEDVPANALEKFLDVQAERFRNPILRIFHTELEAVYEEKNRSLDNDAWKVQEASMAAVFPTHNYGQQTTIGTIEHLKNPSLVAIRDYYNKYYVPNNMAIVLSGDFNPDQVIKMIDTRFAFLKNKPVSEYAGPKEAPLKGPVVREVVGPNAENLRLTYRVGANHSREALLAGLAARVLSNGKAGLLDLNLNKQQKVQSANAGITQFKDYGTLAISVTPKQGQTLEQARDLALGQIEALKNGEFEERLIAAIAANQKLSEEQGIESNGLRVGSLVDAFIKHRGTEWNKDVSQTDDQAKVTKAELVAFAKQFFTNDNYVIVYKRKGEDKSIVKVEKPSITPVETNAGKQSPFVKAFMDKPQGKIAPVWVDYSKDMQKGQMGSNEVLYTPNTTNSLFVLNYRFPMGSWNSKTLSIALQYLQFLGAGNMSAEDISKEFYNLACSFNTGAGNEETNVSLVGLQQNFDKAVALLENVVRHCKPDEAALAALKNRILRQRANNKLNRGVITNGLRNYAQFGPNNPFNYGLTEAELNALTAQGLVDQLHNLFNFSHSVLYYGPQSLANLTTALNKQHPAPASPLAVPAAASFTRTTQDKNRILFTHYDMVQAELYWTRNMGAYNENEEHVMNAFNGYFGAGMSTVVFQTIRESKALAYSTYAVMQAPGKKEDPFTAVAYVGTQADKLNESLGSMNELLTALPMNEQNFQTAMSGLKKDIETDRVTKDNILNSYWSARRKGLSGDPRKAYYEALQKMTSADLVNYHKNHLSGKPWTYYIMASDQKVKLDDLAKYGEVKKLDLKEIFGF